MAVTRIMQDTTLQRAYDQARDQKITKYEALFRNTNDRLFKPLVGSAYGRMEPETVTTLKSLLGPGGNERRSPELNMALKRMSYYILRWSGEALHHFYI